MEKKYSNKKLTPKKAKEIKIAYSFKGNPPVTIWATSKEDAYKQFKSLKINK